MINTEKIFSTTFALSRLFPFSVLIPFMVSKLLPGALLSLPKCQTLHQIVQRNRPTVPKRSMVLVLVSLILP